MLSLLLMLPLLPFSLLRADAAFMLMPYVLH